MIAKIVCAMLLLTCLAIAQSEDAYSTDEGGKKSFLLDPSRLSVQNSISFGAQSGGGNTSLQSQSLYTTMMRYQFVAPVTLNLNFSLPIHSTFSSMQNLNSSNLQSMDYFKSVPFEMSLAWQPTKNMLLQFSFIKSNYNNSMGYGYDPMYHSWGQRYHRFETMK